MRGKKSEWDFLTNHAYVLACVYQDPDATMGEVARRVGITERAVQRIIAQLADARYLTVTRLGRRNTYEVSLDDAAHHRIDISKVIKVVIASEK